MIERDGPNPDLPGLPDRWRKIGAWAFGTFSTIIMIICVMSLVYPTAFRILVDDYCSILYFTCAPSFLFDDAKILKGLSYIDYADGFLALRKIGALLTLLFSLALVIISLKSKSYVYQKDIKREILIISLVFFALWTWWVFFSPDFYSAHDGDFSGALRPPIGTFAYGVGLIGAAIGLTGCIMLLFKKIFVMKNHKNGGRK